MNLVDLFLISVILLSAGIGYFRGFVSGLLDIFRWIISFLLALAFYLPAAQIFAAVSGWAITWTKPFAFLLLIFGISFLLQYLGGFLIRKLPKDLREDSLNRAFGVLPGFISGLILAVFISASLFSLPISGDFQDSLGKSRLAEPLAIYSDRIQAALSPIFEEAIAETLTHRLTTHPGSDETVELPFKVEEFRARPDLEAEMLVLINKERAAENLAPLAADAEMREVAVKHSADMFRRGYFAHDTPEGKDPFERMKDDKVNYRTAGENLALAPTLKIAHTGLMNSPGHRANIMRPQFGRVGIGILDGGRRGLMITQNFRN